jgi:photosystem II stability/assembly factor-like uncharacterized protein
MRGWLLWPATALTALVAATPLWSAPSPDVSGALEWRLVGPFRGGWATTVAGAGGASNTFYLGAAGGGVWKTEDAGLTWRAAFDGIGSASVGALAVAPSRPETVYAGMGQVTSRYDITPGDGVYRSDDAGRTWRNVGLASSRHVGAIAVDPRSPETVLVAALGSVFGPGPERGVYRTTDGGKNWTRTLFVSENTGAVDLALDPEDPRVVFASVWQVRHRPWLAYFKPDTGPESGVYRSNDGGVTWARIAGGGWPANDLGRIGLAVSHRPQGTRVWAVIDAEQNGGLYRSDDAGRTWLHVNDDHELISSYFAKLTPMPGDPDTVFSMGRGIQRCARGGSACDVFKGAPGGDDYHFLWIDPQHPQRMITGADQGAVITTNGGSTWSSWYNQPTGQFYKLATDSTFPYRIFGGQQDSGTVRISSRSDDGSITFRDWRPVGGDERDYQVADPRNPDIVYSSGLGGRLSRWNARNGEVQNVTPWPIASYGQRPTDFQLRYSWITPIAISPLAPYPLYQGSQQLWRSIDQGAHWEAISPDLSARQAQPGVCSGNLEAPRARECGYGVIWSIGLSPRDNDEIWIGTDDGLVRMTGDGGKFWTEVTPKEVPAWAKISTVEPSAIERGVAYIAVDNHRQDDFRPLVYRTRDNGATWALIVNGLPAGHFVSVVRPDPVKAGLLYAGTDIGAYYSTDDGASWQSLQRNLPTAWVRDLLVKGDDLIAATQGRAIWVLDGLAPLRQATGVPGEAKAHLFTPATAIRLRKNQNHDTPLPPEEPAGTNPPTGALIDYWLAAPARHVELEIRDSGGALVRKFASDAGEPQQTVERYFAASWLKPAMTVGSDAGMHRVVWNLRYPPPRTTEYEYSIATAWGAGVETTPAGVLAAPGNYRVVLRVDGKEFTAPLTLVADPRVAVDAAALGQSHSAARDAEQLLARHYETAAPMEYVQERMKELRKEKAGVPAAVAALDAFDASVKPLAGNEGDLPDNLNVKAIGSQLRSLATDIEESDRVPTEPQKLALAEAGQRLDRAAAAWADVRKTALPKLNASLKAAGVEPIVIPPVDRIKLDGPSESKELP